MSSTLSGLAGEGRAVAPRALILQALGTVRDPELDEPITALRFVSACQVSEDGDVSVALRLPTPQCAPNFAYLMAADAREAVRALPGVRDVTVTLQDHYTAAEINAALSAGGGFTDAFPGETEDDRLEQLRVLFQRKSLLARQARLCELMQRAGATEAEVAGRTVADLPPGEDAARCLELRAALGLRTEPDAPALVLPGGDAIAPGGLARWLRMARLVRASLEANGGICRSLLAFRYGLSDEAQATNMTDEEGEER